MKKKIEKCIQKREQLYQNKEVAVKAIHSFFYFYYLLFLAIHSILPFILESDRIMSMLDGNDLIHLYSIFLLYSLDLPELTVLTTGQRSFYKVSSLTLSSSHWFLLFYYRFT